MPALALVAALAVAVAPDLRPSLWPELPGKLQLQLEGARGSDVSRREQNIRITAAVLISAVVVVAAWDLAVSLRGGPSESRMIADWSKQWTVLPLTIGILCGHWFWHAPTPDRPYHMAAVVGASLLWDLSFLLRAAPHGLEAELRHPMFPLLAGVAVGHLLWSQR